MLINWPPVEQRRIDVCPFFLSPNDTFSINLHFSFVRERIKIPMHVSPDIFLILRERASLCARCDRQTAAIKRTIPNDTVYIASGR